MRATTARHPGSRYWPVVVVVDFLKVALPSGVAICFSWVELCTEPSIEEDRELDVESDPPAPL